MKPEWSNITKTSLPCGFPWIELITVVLSSKSFHDSFSSSPNIVKPLDRIPYSTHASYPSSETQGWGRAQQFACSGSIHGMLWAMRDERDKTSLYRLLEGLNARFQHPEMSTSIATLHQKM